MKHLIIASWNAVKTAVFRQAGHQREDTLRSRQQLSHSSTCVWKLDSEA